jgi:hypothetical protein
MNNLTNFSVFLASKSQDDKIGNNVSIATLQFNLNGDLIQYHI